MNKDYYIITEILLLIFLVLLQTIRINKLKNKIREEERLKKEIYKISNSISLIDSKEEIYNYILDSAMKIIKKSNKGSIIVSQEDGNFKYIALKGFENSLMRKVLKLEEICLYKYNRCEEIAIINKGRNGITSILMAPINYSERLVGIISVETLNSNVKFDEDDIKTMKCIRHELELAIKNFLIREKLKYSATRDELTNLYNRRRFNDIFNEEIIRINDSNMVSYFVMIDLDDFKSINDNYGHCEGDRALCKMAESMRYCLGKYESYARMSGDEFVIIFRNISKKEVKEKLEHIREHLKSNLNGIKLDFTYGIVKIDPSLNMKQDEIFSIADQRLYKAKKEKKVGR